LDAGSATLVTQFALTFDVNDTAYHTEPPNFPLLYAKMTELPGRSTLHQTNRLCSFAKISLTALIALGGRAVYAQDPPAVLTPPPLSVPFPEEATKSVSAPCLEPPPMVRIEDYNGPFQKLVGTFAGPLERKSVHPPRYKPGAKLCTLTFKGKFILFLKDSVDPVNFLGSAFDAGIDQAENADPSYEQGSAGYGRRFGAEFGGQISSRFFKEFAYPSIFSEDPRYYRLAHGSVRKRFLHAMGHAVVAHRDDGTRMLNFSEWLGTTSAILVNNTYHPDSQRGFSATAERVSYSILQDVGFDVLREFWPEISHKLKLPFRGETLPATSDPTPAR
jgi:hypothetical protein